VGLVLDVDRHGDRAAELNTVEVDGRTIAFERRGEGPPLLLLHGWLSDTRVWRPQLEALSEEYTVVAWDAPGCGGSSDPPDDFGLGGFADCLAGFVSALGLERPHVVGLSFGSSLALELFRRRPELVRSLVLASAYAGWAGSLGREAAEARREWGLRASEHPPDEVAREFKATLFTESVPAALVDEMVEIVRDFHPAGLRAMSNAGADADLRDMLPTIDVPTLLVYGDADQRAPVAVGEAIHEQIPGSRLVVIPGPGHLVNLEAPERFNEEVLGFLKG
jgi:pimeloyl-ACP methyl ester carboxylesterase